MEFDIAEGEKAAETAMLQAPVEFHFKAVNTQQTKTIVDAMHITGPLINYQQNYQFPHKLVSFGYVVYFWIFTVFYFAFFIFIEFSFEHWLFLTF